MSATAQQRVVTPARWIVRLRSAHDAPGTGEIVHRDTTILGARRFIANRLGLKQLRNAYAWETTAGQAFVFVGDDVFELHHQSPEEYAREQNERA